MKPHTSLNRLILFLAFAIVVTMASQIAAARYLATTTNHQTR